MACTYVAAMNILNMALLEQAEAEGKSNSVLLSVDFERTIWERIYTS